MAGEYGVLTRRRMRLAFWVVCGFFLLLHVFIFRNVLLNAPAIIRGDASVVREELVPFFDFSTQYQGSDTSKLTGSDEFRTTYAFWTSWVRYNPFLPFALVLMNALTACILFWAFYRVVRHFSARSPVAGVYVSALAALFIHLILLYSKIAHFYTLVFGFSLFALSLSLALEQLLFYDRLMKRNIAAVTLLACINPAIHYHVIFYLSLGIIVLLHGLFTVAFRRKDIGRFFRRDVLYAVLVSAGSLVPYVLFIHFTTPVNAALSEAPVNYWAIYYSSVPLKYLFSLDSYGHVDLFRYGLYLAPEPRVLAMTVFALVSSLFFFKQWRDLDRRRKMVIVLLFAALLVAMWMSLGYSTDVVYSFHQALGNIALLAAGMHNTFGMLIDKLLSVFINVLRFPHRFEFIVFYMIGLLASIGLLWIVQSLHDRGWRPFTAGALAAFVIVMPFVATPAYRQTFWSGDFNGFLRPYAIPTDLHRIKKILHDSPTAGQNRLFIMPSLESGREIQQDGVNYSFLDKYFIYYLNQPTVYTGTGASPANKIVAYLAYRSIAYNETWWQDVLINDFGVTHVLVPKNLGQRELGTTYLPSIDSKITTVLNESSKFKPVYNGNDYMLYAAQVHRNADRSVMTDMAWEAFLKAFNTHGLGNEALYFPAQMHAFMQQSGKKQLMTDNPERSFYTLYAASHPSMMFKADSTLLPFTKDLLASSNFTTNMFSLTTLYSRDNTYNYTHEVVPNLSGLQAAQFIGLAAHSKQKITFKLTVPEQGTYRLLLHAASAANNIEADNGHTHYTLQKMTTDTKLKDFIDFSYYAVDIQLSKGVHTIQVAAGDTTILTEFVSLLPSDQIPQEFTDVHMDGLVVTPNAEGLYDVVMNSKEGQ
jgi:hypothetical protein